MGFMCRDFCFVVPKTSDWKDGRISNKSFKLIEDVAFKANIHQMNKGKYQTP